MGGELLPLQTKTHIPGSQKCVSAASPELGFLMELGFLILVAVSSVAATIPCKFLPSFGFCASWPGMFSYRFPDKDPS